MAGRIELKGSIGYDKMAPQTVVTTKDGKSKEVYVFKMWAEDYLLPPQTDPKSGKTRPQRTVYQIHVPENKKALFEKLSAGRRVLVRGLQSYRPYATEKNGKIRAYANPWVKLESLEFLDQEPVRMAEQTLGVLSEMKIISEEQHTNFMTAIKGHINDSRSRKKAQPAEDTIVESDSDELFTDKEE